MSELKYKVGDKVRIKSIGWYNKYKDEDGVVLCGEFVFLEGMKKFCSEILTIYEDVDDGYLMLEDNYEYVWTDEMIESLVERNGKTYPYKIGDRVVLKGNNRCATITDLKYNSWGNLSYYVKIDNDKDVSIDYPTDLLLPYDNMVEGLVEEKDKPKNEDEKNGESKPKNEDEVNGEYYSTPKYLIRPSGYQFVDENGNVINAMKIVLEKKKKEYPKTYEECCDVSKSDVIAWLEKQRKETSWKPSKEEMDVLYGLAYITNQYDEHKEEIITRLYQDLKREFFNGSSYENMFPDTEDDVRRRSTIQVLEYAKSLDNYNQYGKEDIDKNIAWLESNIKKPQGKSALEAINEKNIDNQNCVKPTDRVEPKFKIDDIVFVKNIGWVRITNSYWDSLANEYIYEAIGFYGEGEYDSINQSNIECQMLPESEPENPHIGGNRRTLEDIENEYEEITDRAFKGGYEKCQSDIILNGYTLPDGYIFKDENGNEIHALKIVLEKANTLKIQSDNMEIQSDNMETETHRGYYTTEEDTTNKSKKVAWFTFEGNDFADKVELALSNRELIQEDGKWFVVKKKKEYPKTYAECCKVLNYKPDEYDEDEILIYGYMADELRIFQKLLVCRNAYWKIAGDEMGLGKPWESSKDRMVYSFYRHSNEIETVFFSGESVTFEFPTAEMRDAFKENFDPDIEFCKEFL